MIGKLNHVAIVVPDLAVAAALYRDTLGATVLPRHALPEHGSKECRQPFRNAFAAPDLLRREKQIP